jgi:hypothetical protein
MTTDLWKKKGLLTRYKDGKWWIAKNITSISLYDLEGSIGNAVAYLLKIKLPDGFKQLTLEVQLNEGYELVAVALRRATDEEALVLEQEKKAKEEAYAEMRRAQYENLKKEFDS